MKSLLRLVSPALALLGLVGPVSASCAAPEHSSPLAAVSQEPEAAPTADAITFETKAPAAVKIPMVFAQEVGEKPVSVSSEERQRRALIYSAGANVVSLAALEVLLKAEAERRSSAGIRVGGESVNEAVIDEKVREQVDSYLAQVPNGDFWRDRLLEGYTEAAFRRTIALVLRISDMFFPADPELWPREQLMQIFQAGAENSTWDSIEQELTGRLEMKQAGQAFPEMPSDFVFSYIMLPGILNWLRAEGKIEHPADGLPEGIALRVNGVEFKTADLLEASRGLISPVAEETAANWVESLELVESELRERGQWLSRATLDALYEAERKEYEGTIFTHDQAVLDFLGFPSMEHYRQFFDARRSFRATLPDPFPAEWMADEIATRGSFFGLGKVKAEVILIAVVDPVALEYSLAPKIYRPGSDPFTEYHKTALEVAQQLQDGEPFTDVLLQYSNFPGRIPGSDVLQRDRGRFESLTRADLRSLLGESDYTDFLQGYSVGDDIFFRAEIDAVYGPVRGPLGWYLYKVSRREEPTTVLDPVNNPRHAFQLEDDLLTQRFLAFVDGLRK